MQFHFIQAHSCCSAYTPYLPEVLQRGSLWEWLGRTQGKVEGGGHDVIHEKQGRERTWRGITRDWVQIYMVTHVITLTYGLVIAASESILDQSREEHTVTNTAFNNKCEQTAAHHISINENRAMTNILNFYKHCCVNFVMNSCLTQQSILIFLFAGTYCQSGCSSTVLMNT